MEAVQTSEIRWWKASKPAGMAEFGAPVKLSIDGVEVEAPAGASVLNAATAAGLYIPALCAHPDLPPAGQRGAGEGGCNLCMVEIGGVDGVVKACSTTVTAGMVVTTQSAAIQEVRQASLAKVLGPHPHVCLTCPQRDGCSRSQCSYGNPQETRCCTIFSSCELRKISDYIGIPNTTPPYKPAQLPVVLDEPFFDRDYNLCIDCRRCLVACNDVRGVGCLEVKEVETPQGKRTYVGTIAPTLIESGCTFCQACVTVCPTGALMDRTLDPAKREESMVPCKNACPAGIDVPRYVQLAAEGKYGEAIAVVREKLPFPGILGRACFAMCESACRRKDLDDPLSIRNLKRIAADNDTGIWREHAKKLPATGKKAAVIGAGPAGLTVAYYLAKQGHGVTIFDAQPAAGGMARYGIPSYRVPAEVIDNEVAEVSALGVEFRYGAKVESVDTLFSDGYGAVFVGIGAQGGDRLGIPGDDLPGVVDSPTYLKAVTMGLVNTPEGIQTGKKVAVIGGGNVATDNARSSRRFGADVDMVYRRTREEMPARLEEFEGCVEEGVNIRYLLAPKKIEPSTNGFRLQITYAKMALGEADASGRRKPVETGEEVVEGVDLVIAAIGQFPNRFEGFGVETDRKGRITVREDSMLTSRPKVYAGGDCVLGPSTLIESVAQGRVAASAMDVVLGGDGDISEVLLRDGWETSPYIGRKEGFNKIRKFHPIMLAPEQRTGWDEVELGFDDATARAEAARCFKCNLAPKIADAVLPPESSLKFDEATIASVPTESGVFQLLDAEKNVLMIKGVENLREGLMEQFERGGDATNFVFEEAALFTSRESQMIQAYLQQFGKMPGGGSDELDDLF
ncbi:FAD-dependent oxidoreductase [Aromatoleum toluclasticum]|uniref:FAD-dependent oxidoreductase n=1 Tax=Aromatoleum toluclasticum TaxID=92003 RepID=UPI001D182629|nr:FAD-dependent oxidoreductase [Aromatoleum toluclasticum]MCC4117339.1 FAD-dependent oxidoreductase [Aromatoleum toluclasticum]